VDKYTSLLFKSYLQGYMVEGMKGWSEIRNKMRGERKAREG